MWSSNKVTPSVTELGLRCHSAGSGRVWSSGCRVSEQVEVTTCHHHLCMECMKGGLMACPCNENTFFGRTHQFTLTSHTEVAWFFVGSLQQH